MEKTDMKKFVFALFSIIAAHTAVAQRDLAFKFDEVLSRYSDVGLFTGSVLIAQHGKILLDKGYGFSNVKEGKGNTADSKYQIYSVTKPITATLIVKLAEEQRLSLNDRLSKYYPSFPQGDSITIEHLLTHTSGLYCYNNDFSMPVNSEKAMLEFLRKKPLNFSPGTEWEYCNTGYFLLGFIIEKVTGVPYEKAVENYIFTPLGMNHSGFDYRTLKDSNKTTGYAILYDDTSAVAPVYDPHELFAAGGIYSTTYDVYRFHEAMQANKILSPDATRKAYTPFKKNYGFGWFIDSVSGRRIIGHSGGASGYRSYLVRIPEENTVIILLCNSENTDVNAVKKKLLNVMFNEPYKIPSGGKIAHRLLEKYQGAYAMTPRMTIYISAENGRLTARPSMQKAALLLPETESRFYVDDINGYIDFLKAGTGDVDTLVLTQDGKRYTGARIHPSWSVVGSSTPNGWNGPDVKLGQDTAKKSVWRLNTVRLNEGEIKFRFNNDWTFSYGIDKDTHTLVAGGENIKVEAGVYRIIIDMANPGTPMYTITRLE